MKHSNVDYGIAEDSAAPHQWRYTIYPKALRGGHPQPVHSAGYSSYSKAEAACKKEIDLGLSGATVANRS
jgi:hypothetical protein